MQIPLENAMAFFPPSYRAEGVVVGPLTLAHVVRLSSIGVDLGRRVPEELLHDAAEILSAKSTLYPIPYTLYPIPSTLYPLACAVEKVLNDAFETYLKPLSKPEKVVKITPTGLGWPLEMAEFLCSEYGWGFNEAINTPVATAFALIAACRQRNGVGHSGFDYVEREYARSLKKNG